MTKRCSFVFGGQQYDETVQFLCLEGSSMTKRCSFCVWRAAV
jgi:hypothetical protein